MLAQSVDLQLSVDDTDSHAKIQSGAKKGVAEYCSRILPVPKHSVENASQKKRLAETQCNVYKTERCSGTNLSL